MNGNMLRVLQSHALGYPPAAERQSDSISRAQMGRGRTALKLQLGYGSISAFTWGKSLRPPRTLYSGAGSRCLNCRGALRLTCPRPREAALPRPPLSRGMLRGRTAPRPPLFRSLRLAPVPPPLRAGAARPGDGGTGRAGTSSPPRPRLSPPPARRGAVLAALRGRSCARPRCCAEPALCRQPRQDGRKGRTAPAAPARSPLPPGSISLPSSAGGEGKEEEEEGGEGLDSEEGFFCRGSAAAPGSPVLAELWAYWKKT